MTKNILYYGDNLDILRSISRTRQSILYISTRFSKAILNYLWSAKASC